MAGLLDLFDPNGPLGSDQGLMGLSLLAAAAPRRGGRTSIGEGLLGAMQMVNASKRQREEAEMRRQQQAMQMEQMQGLLEDRRVQREDRLRAREQEQKDAGLLQELYTPLPGPTQDQQPLMPRFDPRSLIQQGASLPSVMQAMQLNAAMQPQKPKLLKGGPGDVFIDEETRQPAFSVPDKPEKAPEALRTLAMIFGEGSPEYVKAAQSLAQKMTTHQPGVSVSYGMPMAGTDPQGEPIFFSPPKDPTKDQPVILPGVRPPAKEMPAGMAEKFAQNAVFLQKIDKAIQLVERNPSALGVKNYAPDALVQRVDPGGVETRAMIADVGSQKIYDRSGAAQTVHETARLRPYVPQSTDSPEAVDKKLRALRAEYAAMQKALASGASIKQAAAGAGVDAAGGGPRRISGDAEYNALPSGAEFIGPDGKLRRKP